MGSILSIVSCKWEAKPEGNVIQTQGGRNLCQEEWFPQSCLSPLSRSRVSRQVAFWRDRCVCMCACLCAHTCMSRKQRNWGLEGLHFQEISLLWLTQRKKKSLIVSQLKNNFFKVYRSLNIQQFGDDNDAVSFFFFFNSLNFLKPFVFS